MKKILDLSSWRTALGNLLPSAHGHQGGSRKAIGSMLIMAFAVVGCDDSSSASAGQNDEPAVESSSSSVTLQSSSSVRSSSSAEPALSSAEGVKDLSSSSEKAKSSSSKNEESSSSVKSESSSSDENSQSSSSSSTNVRSSSSEAESSSSSVSVLSSSSLNGFDWSLPKEAYFNPDIDYGEVTDERDGKVYRTVKIGEQTWMAENLNFDPGQGGSGEDKYDWSWCYDNEPRNCDVAGRLYTWAAAIDSVKLANDADNPQDCGYGKTCEVASAGSATLIQGICPSGWHLPSNEEWSALFTAVGGRATAGAKLKSQTGWTAIDGITNEDAYGFSALPAGYRYRSGYFKYDGNDAVFWSATEYGSYHAYNMFLLYYIEYAYLSDYEKYYGFSVRCLKD